MGRQERDEDIQTDPGFTSALGHSIKVIRTDLGISRRDLADRVGISYSYITEIENGNKPPSPSVLGTIAAALGLRMSELVEAAEVRLDGRHGLAQGEPAPGSHHWEDRSLRGSVDEAHVQRRLAAPAAHLTNAAYAMRPSIRGRKQDLRSALRELERLLMDMAPDDVERLLDYARRLVR